MKQKIYISIIVMVFVFGFNISLIGDVTLDMIANGLKSGQELNHNQTSNGPDSLAFIADLHADSTLWNRNLEILNNYGHVDLPRMRAGNVALQVFTVVTRVPFAANPWRTYDIGDMVTGLAWLQGRPATYKTSLLERAISQAEKIKSLHDNKKNNFRLIENKKQLADFISSRFKHPQLTSGIIGLEGAHPLEGKIENFDKLYQAGFRMIALVHFFDNKLGGSAHGVTRGGLTDFGRQVLTAMANKSMILDLSHASKKLIDDSLSFYKKAVIVSHTGVKGTCDNSRNLSDQQIKKISQKGGLIGIGFFSLATCGDNRKDIVNAIKYVVNLVGVSYVAFGSDFDGFVSTAVDASTMKYLYYDLKEAGFTEPEIRKIMGENIRQFFLKNLPLQ